MVFKDVCVFVLWTKVALALEGLTHLCLRVILEIIVWIFDTFYNILEMMNIFFLNIWRTEVVFWLKLLLQEFSSLFFLVNNFTKIVRLHLDAASDYGVWDFYQLGLQHSSKTNTWELEKCFNNSLHFLIWIFANSNDLWIRYFFLLNVIYVSSWTVALLFSCICKLLMLVVANLANTKWCKKPEKWLKPWQMGTHRRAIQWIPTWQGLEEFLCILVPLTLEGLKNSTMWHSVYIAPLTTYARGGRSCERFSGYKTVNRIPLPLYQPSPIQLFSCCTSYRGQIGTRNWREIPTLHK